MKRIIGSLLAVGICLVPLSVPLIAQRSWAQSQNSKDETQLYPKTEKEALQLLKKTLQLMEQSTQQMNQGQSRKAIETLQQILSISRTLKIKDIECLALIGLGKNYLKIQQPQQALGYYNQALPITTIKNLEYCKETIIVNQIGEAYLLSGQPQKALIFFNKALNIFRKSDNRFEEARTLNNIGLFYQSTGQPKEALNFSNQALTLFRKLSNRSGEAASLSTIAGVYKAIGKQQEALKFLNEALTIHRELGDTSGEADALNNIGSVYGDIKQRTKALDALARSASIYEKVGDKFGEAKALYNIATVIHEMSGYKVAFTFYYEALVLAREIKDYGTEAGALNGIGVSFSESGEPKKALEFVTQALTIYRKLGNQQGEVSALNNIGVVYSELGRYKEALNSYGKALDILNKIDDRLSKIQLLSNIATRYQDINRPSEAINYLKKSVQLGLEMRGSLIRENRRNFLLGIGPMGSRIALVDLLIDQNQPESAYEWVNLTTTAELADYNRLVNAKVSNPEAQKAIDQWNQINLELEAQRQQLEHQKQEGKFSTELSRQIRELEAEVIKQAEDISRKFPEVAELFETNPKDIAQLRATIPQGTVIVHPVLLTGVKKVPNTVAIFVLTKDKLTVTKKAINPKELYTLVTEYRKQLEDRRNDEYFGTSEKLYDILIRPVEDQIQAASPTQLSIISSDQLRHIPFETLYDSKTKQYLIQKYPVNYLTRLSSRSWQSIGVEAQLIALLRAIASLQGVAVIAIIGGFSFWVWRRFGILQSGILLIVLGGAAFWFALGRNSHTLAALALGNPVPRAPFNLPAAPKEVQEIAKTFRGSEFYLENQATLDTFKTQAPRFSILHLATHGCFQPEGCCLSGGRCANSEKDMKPNTLLFADQQFNIADAALLGLKNTELLTLSACQTAKEANSNGEEIAGLAYIFERAGARAVIASLWNAQDETSSKIMIQFYENLKKGMSKGEALRQAKLSQVNHHPHPFYWSPFVLIGDAR